MDADLSDHSTKRGVLGEAGPQRCRLVQPHMPLSALSAGPSQPSSKAAVLNLGVK